MSEPTILTEKEKCAVRCGYTYWRDYDGASDPGDLRRCEHGRIWKATGRRRENMWFHELDVWERVDWWTPILYRRAVKALGGART